MKTKNILTILQNTAFHAALPLERGAWVILCLALTIGAQAATQYSSGTKTWSGAVWSSTTGGPYASAWVNGNDAVLEGTAGTVTAVTADTVHNITFSKDSYTISGNNLTLTGTSPTITFGSSSYIGESISSIITGSGGLTITGGGSTALGGANTFTGGLILSGNSRVTTSAAAALGASSGLVTVGSGSGIYVQASHANNFNISGTGWTGDGATPLGALRLNSGITVAGTVTLAADARIWANAASQVGTVSGVISDGGNGYALDTGGNTGTLILSGANTYSGATTISKSVLQLNNQNALQNSTLTMQGLGTLTFNSVVSGKAFTFGGLAASSSGTGYNISLLNNTPAAIALTVGGNNANTTYAGVLSGTLGSLIKTGTGILTLSGFNTYSGSTTINAGKLVGVVGGSCASSAVSVAATSGNTAILSISITDNTKGWTNASLTFNNGGTSSGLDFNFGSVAPSATVAPLQVTGAAAFTTTPAVTVELAANNVTAGTSYPLVAWGSTSGTAPTSVTVTATDTRSATVAGHLAVVGTTLNLVVDTITSTEPLSWTGGNGTWDVSDIGNSIWKDSTSASVYYLDGDTVVFDNTVGSGGTVTLNSTVSPVGVTVNNPSADYTISGSGNIAGTTGLTKSGAGTLTLSTVNTYGGATTISAGTLQLGAAGSGANSPLGTIAGITTVSATGAALDLNGFTLATIEPLTLYGSGISSGGALMNSSATAATYSGLITLGSAASIVSGSGNIVLSAAGTITGSGFGLTLGGTATGSKLASIIGTGVGTVTKNGTGTWTNSGANTYTGVTTINAGTLSAGSATAFGPAANASLLFGPSTTTGKVQLNGNNVTVIGLNSDATPGTPVVESGSGTAGSDIFTVNTSSGSTFAGVLQDGSTRLLALTKAGAGTLTLSGTSSSYTGETIFNAGIVNVASLSVYGANSSLGARTQAQETSTTIGLHFTGGTLQYTGSGAQTTDRYIRIKNGNLCTIDASGATSADTLTFSQAGAPTNFWDTGGARSVTLTGANAGNNTFALNIPDQGTSGNVKTSLIKTGNGTWDVTNTHNSNATTGAGGSYGGYTGGTSISGGTLGFVSGALGASGTIDFTGSSTLRWDSGNTQDISSRIKIEDGITATIDTGVNNVSFATALTVGTAKTGALTKQGSGTLTILGFNTYSGSTTINAGKLVGVVGGSCASSAVSVAATSGNTAILSISITDNTKGWTNASLTFNNGGTSSGLDFNFGSVAPSATVAPLQVTGAAAFTTTPAVTVELAANNVTAGTSYPLVAWGSTSGTAPTSVTVTASGRSTVAGHLAVVGTTLNLVVDTITSTEPLSWTGGNGTWDVSDIGNSIWKDSTSASVYYLDGDTVVFDNTVGSGGTVTLNSTVSPVGVTVNNPSADYTISGSGNIAGTTGLTKSGAGTLTLLGTNSYTGDTTINAGALALGATALFNNTTNIIISAGATYDVSAIATYNLSGTTTLKANGAGTTVGVNAAAINGGTTVNLGTQPISLTFTPTSFTGDGSHPSLYLSAGTLSLGGNIFTVNNAAGSSLGAGTYTIIQQAIGSVTTSGSHMVIVTGSGLVSGCTASISISGGNVNLVVAKSNQTIAFALGTTVIKTNGNAAFADPATASSGLTVTYSSDNTGVATVDSGGTVTIVGVGTCNILADQSGDNGYNAAPEVSQMLTVAAAAPSNVLGSSENPSGYHDAVTFTNTLPADATGYVIFNTNNVLWSSNSLIGGISVSPTITNLPRGTNTITATYSGDTNYLGSVNTLSQIVTNHLPVANLMTVTRTAGLSLLIALSDIATNWSDADGDSVGLAAITMQSTNGVNLMAVSWITNMDGTIATTNATAYIGYTNSPNVNDQISYSISDGQGGTNIGYINIIITNSVTGTNSIAKLIGGNPTTLTAYGIPGYNYIAERSTNLSIAVWVDISTNTAATNGVISILDYFSDLGSNAPASAYYRLRWQP